MGNYEITLVLPSDSPLPTVRGKWARTQTAIEATYSRDELETCLWVAAVWNGREVGGYDVRCEDREPGERNRQALLI
jgi:hypothetical protein